MKPFYFYSKIILMKKTLTSLSLIVVSFISFAGGNLTLKPNIGIGITNFSEDYQEVKSQATIGTEFGLDVLVGKKIYFQTGVRYIRDSYRVSGTINNVEDIKTKVHNIGIKVPLYLGLYLVDIEATNLVKARIFMGPSFKATTSINNEGDDFLDSNKYSDITWGYQVGLGVDIWKVFVDAGYEIGLNEMIKESNVKTNGAYITTGFLIRF